MNQQTKKLASILVIVLVAAMLAGLSKLLFASFIVEALTFLIVFAIGVMLANKYILKKSSE